MIRVKNSETDCDYPLYREKEVYPEGLRRIASFPVYLYAGAEDG